MSELPEDVFGDILTRLSPKDLLRFRCVSKRWCALIDSPRFIKLQLNRSLETGTNLSLIYRNDSEICSVDLDMLDGDSVERRLVVVEVDNPIPIQTEDCWTSVEGSCNGLICLHRYIDEVIALLNPSTKEYIILPPLPPLHEKPLFAALPFTGLVYDPVGDDYKVVQIVQYLDRFNTFWSEVMVCSLRSKMWRRVCESFAHHLYVLSKMPWLCSRNPGVLVNGALHWLACRDRVDLFDIVVAFDPVVEEHWVMEVPKVSGYSKGTLGVLGGCLCLICAMKERDTVELWVMNNYRVEESWTKLFRVMFEVHSPGCPRVLAYCRSSREVILLEMFGNLIWYDLKEKKAVDLGICSSFADVNVKSLVKLNHYQ
ncbi:F-box protein CPR1-like [Cornus florida]|uniref:F-box protein CPR1-like n=1 Tax=Cornus florida TaxID=4283 RepID=UPI0028A1A2E5|nr:F-box protein CPR1-like [Cornus florida]